MDRDDFAAKLTAALKERDPNIIQVKVEPFSPNDMEDFAEHLTAALKQQNPDNTIERHRRRTDDNLVDIAAAFEERNRQMVADWRKLAQQANDIWYLKLIILVLIIFSGYVTWRLDQKA